MPQLPNSRVNFGDILDAISAQLLTDGVAENASQITWGMPDQIPQFAAPFDVLLVARNGQHEVMDAGPGQFQILRYVDIYYRSQAIADPGGGWRAYIRAAFVTADKIFNSVSQDGFWPEDANNNLLTVEPIKFVGDVPPDYPAPAAIYGSYVATVSCLYMPKIDPNRGVFPIP